MKKIFCVCLVFSAVLISCSKGSSVNLGDTYWYAKASKADAFFGLDFKDFKTVTIESAVYSSRSVNQSEDTYEYSIEGDDIFVYLKPRAEVNDAKKTYENLKKTQDPTVDVNGMLSKNDFVNIFKINAEDERITGKMKSHELKFQKTTRDDAVGYVEDYFSN